MILRSRRIGNHPLFKNGRVSVVGPTVDESPTLNGFCESGRLVVGDQRDRPRQTIRGIRVQNRIHEDVAGKLNGNEMVGELAGRVDGIIGPGGWGQNRIRRRRPIEDQIIQGADFHRSSGSRKTRGRVVGIHDIGQQPSKTVRGRFDAVGLRSFTGRKGRFLLVGVEAGAEKPSGQEGCGKNWELSGHAGRFRN